MSRLVDCWKAVEDGLCSQAFLQPITVHRKYYNEFDRSDNDETVNVYLLCDLARDRILQTKKADAETFRMTLVIRRKLPQDGNTTEECDKLIDVVEEITDWIHGRTFKTYYKCNSLDYDAEFAPADIRGNLFSMAFNAEFLSIQTVRS